jgi:hypothetical protein
MMQQRKPNIARLRSWWQNRSKAFNAVIVTSLVALLRIMVSWLRSWWQNTSKKRKIAQIIVLVVVVGLIVSFIGGYFFNWTWTGFGPYTPPASGLQRGITLYEWLQLLIIPAALAFGIWWLNRLQQQRDQQLADERAKVEREAAEKRADTEREIALDNQRAAALQAYIDSMSELLLEKNLRKSSEDDEVRKIAHVRTLTVLPRLDGNRKGSVLQFLHEAGLIVREIKDNSLGDTGIVSLYKADLRGANLSEAFLIRAYLTGADLSGANLSRAILDAAFLIEVNLKGARLDGADLYGAILIGADLTGANLSFANLCEAEVSNKQLDEAISLKDATMQDGTKHA